jgi:hypothetical protein
VAKKKAASKKRSDFASAAEYKRYKTRSNAQKKRWADIKAKELQAYKVTLVNMHPSIRGLMTQLEPLSLEESERVILALKAQLAAEQLTRGFVDSNEIEKLHKDMTIALMPSRLRHLGSVTDEMEKMLKRAHRKGERALRKQAKEYAAYFDVPLREVYTLFFSP